MAPVDVAIAALETAGRRLHRSGGGWIAQCPAHEDEHESLALQEGDDGRVLLRCHAGCDTAKVLSTMGLKWADLFPPRQGQPPLPAPRQNATATPALSEDVAERTRQRLLAAEDVITQLRTARGWEREAIESLRLGLDGARITFPVRDGKGRLTNLLRWTPNPREGQRKMLAVKGGRRELFPAPETLESDTIWLVEGEPDAVSARTLGLSAVAVPGVSWRTRVVREAARFRRFRRVSVLLDCDRQGREAAAAIADGLSQAGIAAAVIDLDPFRNDGYDLGDLVREAAEDGAKGLASARTLLETIEVDAMAKAQASVHTRSGPALDANNRGSSLAGGVRYPLTDLGNAERLVARYEPELRFVPGLGWLVWTGGLWERDDSGGAMRRAKKTVRAIYAEAANTDDADGRKRIASWATTSEGAARLRAMIGLAESDERVIALPRQLDSEPWLFACGNGTLDLRTAELRAPNPAHLLTRGTLIAYRPDAEAPLFHKFLEDVFDGDADLISFVQRWAGYCLTGDTREQCFAILYGAGANGKSTLVEALKRTSGSFALEAAFQTFAIARSHGRDPRDDLAALRGARMVTASEPGRGRWLDTEVVKKITGGDELTCRELYGKDFTYRPSYKVMVLTNNRPRIDADDEAMWRRVKLIPFMQSFRGREDRHLSDKLRAENEGILAWRVEGCRLWNQSGLGEANAVVQATADYRRSEDHVGRFLDDACELEPASTTPTAAVRREYERWCESEDERLLNPQELGRRLASRGIERVQIRVSGERVWSYRGVRVT